MMLPIRWRRTCALTFGLSSLFLGEAFGQDEKKDAPKDPLPKVGVEAPKLPPPAADVPTDPAPPQEPQFPQSILDATYRGSPFGNFNAPATNFGATIPAFDNPRSTSVLDQAQIRERAAGATPQLLQGLPGVLIQRTNMGGGSLIIRGRNGNQNLIMIDGIPINDAGWRIGNVQYLNYVDPGVIDRFEVTRGPASVLYGSGAIGGTLNLISKSRKDFSQNLAIGGGVITSYSTALHDPYNRVEVSGNFQNLGVYAGGTSYVPGFLDAGGGVAFPEYATGYEQLAGDVRLDWRINDTWVATFCYMHMFQNDVPRTDRFPLRQLDPVLNVNRPTYADNVHDFGYVRLSRYDEDAVFFHGVQITSWLQRRDERENEFDLRGATRDLFIRSEEVNYGGVDLRTVTNVSDNHRILMGFTYQCDLTDSGQLRIRNNVVTNRPPILPPNGFYSQIGAFLLDYLDITDSWSVYGGVRYSEIHARGLARQFGNVLTPPQLATNFDQHYQDWTPEFGTVYKISDNLHWVGSFAEGFRAPNLEDLGSAERATSQGSGADNGNTLLGSERVLNYETGFKYRSERLEANATYFYQWIPSQIIRAQTGPAPGLPTGVQTRANTRGYLYGTEAEFAALFGDSWSLFGNVSYCFGQDTTVVLPAFGGFAAGRGAPLRVPPVNGILGLRWTQRSPNYGLFAEFWTQMMGDFDHTTPFDATDPRVSRAGEPGWQTLNLRAGIDSPTWGQLSLGLYNLADQHYRILGSGLDAPGFEFRFGYQVSF